MKQKDIALIIVVVVVSGILSFVLGRFIFDSPKNRSVQAQVVEPISTDFNRPDPKYFNESSINPTQQIQIGGDGNITPFSGRQ